MNVSLTPEQLRFIEQKVGTGRYRTAAEVVREGMRLLMEREIDEERRQTVWREEVRRKIDEGYEESLRGKFVDGEKVFEKLRRRIATQRKKKT
jgi:antitoxin ParD1/3/4